MKKIRIPSSKSISNRALIVNALTGFKCDLQNLSTANDTQLMQSLLQSDLEEIDVEDAGTVMRFLTSYFCISGQHKILKGSDRMHERPIKILVDGLKTLGGQIEYLKKKDFPPIKIKGFQEINSCLELNINASVSSQYISSLLLVAPLLPQGLRISLDSKTKIASKPYIVMTLQIMNHFGIKWKWKDGVIEVEHQEYVPEEFTIEPDWSSASYWYSMVAVSKDLTELYLEGYDKFSLQGDANVAEIYQNLGVQTFYEEKGIRLVKNEHCKDFMELDFSDTPDLAQTVLVTCALLKINLRFTGVESLKIKETDRLRALNIEFEKIGCAIYMKENEYVLDSHELSIPSEIEIDTYKDHRMAMAFAPLKLFTDVKFDDESVVVKSYPSFWKDFKIVCG